MANDMKVYELAKNLGVKSVFLMNKIRREWKLPVKSHMESLSSDMVKKIEKKFLMEKGGPAVKPKTRKKKTVKKTAATQEQPPARPSAPGTSKIIRRRKEDLPDPAPVVSAPASDSLKSAGPSSSVSPEPSRKSSGGIRSDMVSVKAVNPLESISAPAEEPVKKPPRRPLAEKEVEVKFHASDFRKREVIFQPRKKRTVTAGEVKKTQITRPKSHKRIIKIHGDILPDDLAGKMGIKRKALIHKLKSQGVDIKGMESLDFETAALIAPEWGFEVKNVQKTEEELLKETLSEDPQKSDGKTTKPPVVTVMGHVDHGKTTLLDAIRKTRVAQGEAGGITQHIGAYSVEVNGRPVTFIDTPGHEAFTAMRARGAEATDIVVIVVSATDGVQPQTLEAVNHAKTAKTPIIVAINKMDAEGADPDRVKQALSKNEVIPEDWGGDTSCLPLSALKGDGIKELLEQIQLVAEMRELKCDPKKPARGVVVESSMEKGQGPVVTLLVQDGTLTRGQNVLVGRFMGRIRQMKSDQGRVISSAGPGFPVEVTGFSSLPSAGDLFYAVKDEKAARELIKSRQLKQETEPAPSAPSVEDLLEKTYGGQKTELKLIVKADVLGSLEALTKSLREMAGEGEEVSLQIIHSAVGGITESDVLLASTVSGKILGFNVRADGKAGKSARDKSVEIHYYSVIYEILDEVKKMMIGLLPPKTEEEVLGSAEVREIFHISKVGTVAGCYVNRGKVTRDSSIRVVRDGRLIHEGKVSSLKRFKEDSKEVKSGFECGLSLQSFNDLKPKDTLESYIQKEVIRTEL